MAVSNNSATSINPTNDTFIRGSTYANTNYGSTTTMRIKKSENDKYTRYGYLKFDLSQVDANRLLTATLRLKASTNSINGVSQELLKAPSDN